MRSQGVLTMTAALALGAGARRRSARADCTITVGLVMELTGPAGEYGQAGAKSVEMAFRDLNDAGGAHGCKLVTDTRDSQSQGTVAVDAATQLVQVKKVPVIIGGIISSVSIPILTSVTGAGQGRAGLARLLLADADRARPRGQDQRHLLPHHHLGRAARRRRRRNTRSTRASRRSPSSTSTTISASTWTRSSPRAYKALGGEIVSVTPYNEKQSSYDAEVTAGMAGKPDGLYLIAHPGRRRHDRARLDLARRRRTSSCSTTA